ncbi:nuclear transport factor 2 family protein [Cellulomonas sp. URHD0024]|uniref:nuclear transport factor 2 family protein n=1 Tax=Cellulomonas sp. URHD0024 TaxID=1302620 RepID=UPI000403EECB|nr:nuclear transport factor 2 family protein [Cellulomonas sp. URHD0024]
MAVPHPAQFSAAWEAAWNARDLDAVLAHFHDDVVFTSPVAARIVPDTGGIVRGKAELRAYCTAGLRLVPDLHFTVEDVYAGISILVLQYRNQRGDVVDEVLLFDDDGLVVEGHGTARTGGVHATGEPTSQGA